MKSLYLSSGETFKGEAFGSPTDCLGEVVFTTGMTGYLETLTDPSYYGQIVCFTFPLIGNYGVFDKEAFAEGVDKVYESEKIWVKGVILTEVSEAFSHCQAFKSFEAWLKDNGIPALKNVDTRRLTQSLRAHGCIMGSISSEPMTDYTDPLSGCYVPEVSPEKVTILEPEIPIGKTIAFIDCGAKNGILRNFLARGIRVIRCPFNQNPFDLEYEYDGVFFSNGPGDPEKCTETIEIMKETLQKDLPVFGICLGNQILALGSGGKTRKMKYGHRSINQPCQEVKTKKCIVTSQNHGFEVDASSLSAEYEIWFTNLNDGTCEGIRHRSKPVSSVQFHPEACSGPEDAQYLFDEFIKTL